MNEQLKNELETSNNSAAEALLDKGKDTTAAESSNKSSAIANKPEYSGVYTPSEAREGLESDIPNLENGIGKRVNRKAIAFLVLMGLVIASIIAYAMSKFSGKEQPEPIQQVEETVSIPSSPVPAFTPTEDVSQASSSAIPANQQQALPSPPDLVVMPNVPTSMENISFPNVNGQPSISEGVPSMPVISQNSDASSDNRLAETGSFVVSENNSGGAGNSGVKRLQAQKLYKPDYLLVQGTYIRCILSSKIVSDIPGNTSCVVTEPVYSAAGTKLLLPKGSKVIGSYGSGAGVGSRIGVAWNRIITPNNLDIQMDSLGTDNLGGSGHPGDYRSHWVSRLGSALLISLIGDGVDYIGDKNSSNEVTTTSSSTTVSPKETQTARTLEKMAQDELNRLGMRPPTITINQGEILNIFVSQDVDFENVIKE